MCQVTHVGFETTAVGHTSFRPITRGRDLETDMHVCEISDESVALGSLGRPRVLGKQGAMETEVRESAVW